MYLTEYNYITILIDCQEGDKEKQGLKPPV